MVVVHSKKKLKKKCQQGIVVIKATFNNTIITITTPKGDVLCRKSAGSCGFKGSRKSAPYAAQLAAEQAAHLAKQFGMVRVVIKVQGPGAGRDSAIRSIHNVLSVVRLEDVTRLPYNGCRPRKRKRD